MLLLLLQDTCPCSPQPLHCRAQVTQHAPGTLLKSFPTLTSWVLFPQPALAWHQDSHLAHCHAPCHPGWQKPSVSRGWPEQGGASTEHRHSQDDGARGSGGGGPHPDSPFPRVFLPNHTVPTSRAGVISCHLVDPCKAPGSWGTALCFISNETEQGWGTVRSTDLMSGVAWPASY